MRTRLTVEQEEETIRAFALFLGGMSLGEVIELLGLGITKQTLSERFKRRYECYKESKPTPKSQLSISNYNIINVLFDEYASNPKYSSILPWLKENLHEIARYEAKNPLKVLTKNQENSICRDERCGLSQQNEYLFNKLIPEKE